MILPQTVVAIVPAAGLGKRMKINLPKQYLKIGSLSVLDHTLSKLLSCQAICRIIVAIDKSDMFFNTLKSAKDPKVLTVVGGATRADSVLSALSQVKDNEWALVHDAARPCITQEDINKLIQTVFNHKEGGILAVPIVDTVKWVTHNHPRRVDYTVDRECLWRAVTPQLFLAKQLRAALKKASLNQVPITDEASAIEYIGGHPLVVPGRSDNMKITHPQDLPLATWFLNEQEVNRKNDEESECE